MTATCPAFHFWQSFEAGHRVLMVGRKKRLQTVGEMQIAPALHIQLEYSRRIPCERSVAGMIVTRLDLHADNASRNHKQDSNENDNSCAPLSGAVLGRSLAVLGPCWALLDLLCAVLSCLGTIIDPLSLGNSFRWNCLGSGNSQKTPNIQKTYKTIRFLRFS